MLLVMKFSSSTPRGKAALDKQLKSDVVGLFSGPALFTSTLQRLHQQDHEVDEVLLYAQGTGRQNKVTQSQRTSCIILDIIL